MLHAAYRSIVRKLPVSVKAPIKRIALSIVGGSPASIVESPTVQPEIVEPVTPPIDPVQSRMEFAESYFRNAKLEIAKWAHHSRENDNFTFELTKQNLDYLAATISTVTGAAQNHPILSARAKGRSTRLSQREGGQPSNRQSNLLQPSARLVCDRESNETSRDHRDRRSSWPR